MSWDQIASLTDRQILDIYYRKRDKNGIPLDFEPDDYDGDEIELTEEQTRDKYFSRGAALGVPKASIESGWRDYMLKKHEKETSGE